MSKPLFIGKVYVMSEGETQDWEYERDVTPGLRKWRNETICQAQAMGALAIEDCDRKRVWPAADLGLGSTHGLVFKKALPAGFVSDLHSGRNRRHP